MKLARTELAEVLAERTMTIDNPKLLAQEIAAYLLTQNRTADLESLIRDIMQLRAEKGVVEGVAVSAHELDNQILEDARRVLRHEFPDAKQVLVRERRDPEVVGGVRIRLSNEHLDMTVKSKLNTFKRITAGGIK